MPAHCCHCGGTVMSYRQSFFHLRPTATCAACGKSVRLRRSKELVWIAIVVAAGSVGGGLLLIDSQDILAYYAVGVVALFLALHWWCWRTFEWEPVSEVDSP